MQFFNRSHACIIGPPGEQGIQGARGVQGEVGPQGERGEVILLYHFTAFSMLLIKSFSFDKTRTQRGIQGIQGAPGYILN